MECSPAAMTIEATQEVKKEEPLLERTGSIVRGAGFDQVWGSRVADSVIRLPNRREPVRQLRYQQRQRHNRETQDQRDELP